MSTVVNTHAEPESRHDVPYAGVTRTVRPAPPRYRNEIGNRNNWLQVEVSGTHCNRDAIGTRVTVVSGNLSQIRELDGGNGNGRPRGFTRGIVCELSKWCVG